MRAQSTLLLLLTTTAYLASTVSAVPSVGIPRQHQPSLQPTHERRPLWRSVSDAIRKICAFAHMNSPYQRQPARVSQALLSALHHSQDLVLRFNITSTEEAASLSEAANTLVLDVWEFTDDWVDIRLAKDTLPDLLALLPPSLQNTHTPLLQGIDLGQAILDTYPSHHPGASEADIFFSNYQPLSVIQPWMRLMASLFTTHVRLINIGISYEGRDIPALKIGAHPTNRDAPERRKTILMMGGIHAREWISTATVNYIAHSLITAYGKSRVITQLVDDFDWVFIPTINPDGYAYSWETDRLWRKNRQETHLRFCHGLDLDRSFGFEWDGAPAKSNPCSESYAGDAPFQAVEAQRLADWARNETAANNADFVGFLDLHSYSQQILYPYSYSCDAAPPNLENLQELAAGLAKAIRLEGGRSYQAAPACEGNVGVVANTSSHQHQRHVFPRFESGGGSGLDWFYHELKVRYTYQIKLRDRGSYGFLLPKAHIVPSGKEMLDATVYFGRYLSEQFGLVVAENATVSGRAAGVSSQDGTSEVEVDGEDEDEAMWELKRRRRH